MKTFQTNEILCKNIFLITKEFGSSRIEALCECSAEDKKGEPRDVLYGWCLKCRAKFPQDYKKVEG